eukprot:Sspe_Gene.79560::Locus_49920_Transcript_2_3_Confidence_0.400_Length_1177::g.79560::m.79560/K16742/ARL2BP, BART; ADP-ribosylation factor-like protein 2-binding protein
MAKAPQPDDDSTSTSSIETEESEEDEPSLVDMSQEEVAVARAREARQHETGLPHRTERRRDPYDMLPAKYREGYGFLQKGGSESSAVVDTSPPAAAARPTTANPLFRATARAALAASLVAAVGPTSEAEDKSDGEEVDHPSPSPPRRAPLPVPSASIASPTLPTEDMRMEPGALADMLDEQIKRGDEWFVSSADRKFDIAQAYLEEMVEYDERFQAVQEEFKEEHCDVFEEGEESKLIYWEKYQLWIETIEGYIRKRLENRIPGFSMEDFLEILHDRGDEVSGEVWELLTSLTDYQVFREAMLEYKAGVDGPEYDRDEMKRILSEGERIAEEHKHAAAAAAAEAEARAKEGDGSPHSTQYGSGGVSLTDSPRAGT